MFVGHYSVAFAVRTEQNRIPLWVLFVPFSFSIICWRNPACFSALRNCGSLKVSPLAACSTPIFTPYSPYATSQRVTFRSARWLAYCTGTDSCRSLGTDGRYTRNLRRSLRWVRQFPAFVLEFSREDRSDLGIFQYSSKRLRSFLPGSR